MMGGSEHTRSAAKPSAIRIQLDLHPLFLEP